jgi:hypothetical protein
VTTSLGVVFITDVAERVVATANTIAGAVSDGEMFNAESMRSMPISFLQSSCSNQ